VAVGRIVAAEAQGEKVFVKLDVAQFRMPAPDELVKRVYGRVPQNDDEAREAAFALRKHRGQVELPNLNLGPQNAGKRPRRVSSINGKYITFKAHMDPLDRKREMRRRKKIMKADLTEVSVIAKGEGERKEIGKWPTLKEVSAAAKNNLLSVGEYDSLKGTLKLISPPSLKAENPSESDEFWNRVTQTLEDVGLACPHMAAQDSK